MIEFFVALAAIVAVVFAALSIGAARWRVGTRALHARLGAERLPVAPTHADFVDLRPLPVPVQRWLRQVLVDGQPLIETVAVHHIGQFNTSPSGERWRPFRSEQRVQIRRPGFVWDARISMLPGVVVRVHDAYVGGSGVLRASVAGLVRVLDLVDVGALAEGELMRFVAEAAWYPAALLPSPDVRWRSVDDRSAEVTLDDGRVRVTLRFQFDDAGLLERVRSEGRGRLVDGVSISTPWEGRFWNYQRRAGMLVPVDGEVAWILPSGRLPYWRGHIDAIDYGLAG